MPNSLPLQKKGGKVQKQVQMMEKQATTAGKSKEVLAKERERDLKAQEKAAEEKRKKENAELFKPVQTQKVPFGVGELLYYQMDAFRINTDRRPKVCSVRLLQGRHM